MHYHILLTENCNLRCRYCYEKSMCEFDNSLEKRFTFDYSNPEEINIDLEKLKSFLLHDRDPVLIFYGGEPLLNIEKIKEIIALIPNIKFRMQTNGILLNKLEPEYLNKIGKMLISLDGNCKRTNFNRGNGIYERVINNIKEARKKGYTGEIVARMTIAQDTPDLYEQVIHLVELIDEGIIDSVHWQLDVGFYSKDYNKENVEKFFKEYNSSNKKLIDWWIRKINEGKIYKFYPYVGIVHPLLQKKTNLGLRCGAGHSGYAITTGGKLVHCPIMNNIEDFKAGDLESKPNELKKISCKNECRECEAYDLCGGRCMYWRKAKLWPKEGDLMICNSIITYINYLKEKLPGIRQNSSSEDFEYEDYFGPEIIP